MTTGRVWLFYSLLLAFNLSSTVLAAEQTAGQIEAEIADSEKKPNSPGYVFGVTVSTANQLDVILDRADSLREHFNPDQHSRIAIVLHGEELQLFQKNNYSENQSIVDRARLLDAAQIIDIKACQTMMRSLDIQQSELPSFIEQVPLAPVEIERLKTEQGFTLF